MDDQGIKRAVKKFHIALAVADVAQSVIDYSARLGVSPVLVVPNEYALWRTEMLNLSIRKTTEAAGTLRHLGWEDSNATAFSIETDVNGIKWERFSAAHQTEELNSIWPDISYKTT